MAKYMDIPDGMEQKTELRQAEETKPVAKIKIER